MTTFGKRESPGMNIDPEAQWNRELQEMDQERIALNQPGLGLKWWTIPVLKLSVPVGVRLGVGWTIRFGKQHKKTPSPRLPHTKTWNDKTGVWEDLE